MSRHAGVALAIAAVGIAGIVLVIVTHGSVRSYVDKRYTLVGTEPVPNDDDVTRIYASAQPVGSTVRDIADAHKPADRRVTEAGTFLRYSKDVVAVMPDGRASRIMVNDEDGGYRRHYGYVGGWWGSYSGPAEAFRGGGPGAGK